MDFSNNVFHLFGYTLFEKVQDLRNADARLLRTAIKAHAFPKSESRLEKYEWKIGKENKEPVGPNKLIAHVLRIATRVVLQPSVLST